jgi:hypothetical protein
MCDRLVRTTVAVVMLGLLAGCSNPLGRQYEYEEQLYLSVDGSARLVIDASLPSLVALFGLPLDPSLQTRVDREQIRRMFMTPQCPDVRVAQPWIRHGRRFVQIRITTPDVVRLKSCGPLSWSSYEFAPEGTLLHFTRLIGPGKSGDPGKVNWDGSELVAFKLHLPSRIAWHNLKRLDNGLNGEAERGNILTWEQTLASRRGGQPVDMQVRMDSQSILYRTLWLFAGAFAAAILVLVTLIWMTVRRARRRHPVVAAR